MLSGSMEEDDDRVVEVSGVGEVTLALEVGGAMRSVPATPEF